MAAYIEANQVAWRNDKHTQQWSSTLETYALPHFGEKVLADIDTNDVLAALRPIWTTKAETASRLRGRIEAVLNWGAAHGHRQGENPARWKGHLEMILPAKSKVAKVKHHAAMDYKALPQFMAAMRGQGGAGVLACWRAGAAFRHFDRRAHRRGDRRRLEPDRSGQQGLDHSRRAQ
jgi:hypothetical protein